MTRADVEGKKVYIAGKITGLGRTETWRKFGDAERMLRDMGATPFNPTRLPEGFSWYDYMNICFTAIRACDAIYLLDNWQDSDGAKQEQIWAQKLFRSIYYQGE